MSAASDEELMEQYRMGDSRAFNILFQRHSPRVLSYLKFKSGSEKLAQDLLQDVFLKFHRSRHQYIGGLPFLPWLYSIMRSVLLDQLKRKRLEDLVGPSELDQIAAETAPVDTPESAVLDLLPDAQKQAVSMRVLDEATFDEIAQRLSTTPDNARQLVSRALKKLRVIYALKGKNHER